MANLAQVLRDGVWSLVEGIVHDTGDYCHSARSSKTGWMLCDGSSIGPVSSGADHEGGEFEALFEILKANAPNAGTESWGGGGTVFLPDWRGRCLFGRDDMGGSAASRITVAGTGVNGTTLGNSGGAETHQLTEAQLASHFHGGDTYRDTRNIYQSGGPANAAYFSSLSANTGAAGDDEEHNNMPPFGIANLFIKI